MDAKALTRVGVGNSEWTRSRTTHPYSCRVRGRDSRTVTKERPTTDIQGQLLPTLLETQRRSGAARVSGWP